MPTIQTHPQVLPPQPFVSFIVTTYNLPTDWLCTCLQSITALALGTEEYEIILVDDGSDISPLPQLEASVSHSIIYIYKENQGPAAARNAGLERAQGEYVQFVDGDDALLPLAYNHCIDFLKRERPDLLFFRHAQGKPLPDKNIEPEGPMTGCRYLATYNLRVAVWGYAFRRERLGDLRFDAAYRSEEDEDFTPRLLLRMQKVYATTARPYFYRTRPDSLTTDRRRLRTDRRLHNTESILSGLQKLATSLPAEAQMGIRRRTAQLTADLLYNVLRFTRSLRRLCETKRRLRAAGLYPLPNAPYGWKYKVFRQLIRWI